MDNPYCSCKLTIVSCGSTGPRAADGLCDHPAFPLRRAVLININILPIATMATILPTVTAMHAFTTIC